MLSDGDSKAFSAIKSIYNGIVVVKEECINHVHKRLGYHLRKVSNAASKDKVVTGGRGPGKLTGDVITKLSKYYAVAVSIFYHIHL